MNINLFDIIILCTISFFSIRGLMQGFVAEILGLVAIFGGFFLANKFYLDLAFYLNFIENPLWKDLAAYIIIFIAVGILVNILHSIIQKLVNFSFVGWLDSLSGLILGCVKGLLLCTVMLILINKFSPDMEILNQSLLIPYLDRILTYANNYIPLDLLSNPEI